MFEKIPVTFLTTWRCYNPGEVAGFDPKLAAELIASGIAKPYPDPDPPKEDPPKEDPPKDPDPPAKPKRGRKTQK